MRLKTKHIFKLAGIIKKLNLKKEMEEVELDKEAPEKYGAQLLLLILENMHKAESDVAELFADMAGVTTEEFLEMDAADFSADLIQFFGELKDHPVLADFFQSFSTMEEEKKQPTSS